MSEQGYRVGKILVWNVRYYWMQEQVNHLCPNHIIYSLKLYIPYQNLHLKLNEFK